MGYVLWMMNYVSEDKLLDINHELLYPITHKP
jgi:hypothetical protein